MRYRLQRHDGTDCSATMVPITVLRMVPIQRYRQKREVIKIKGTRKLFPSLVLTNPIFSISASTDFQSLVR